MAADDTHLAPEAVFGDGADLLAPEGMSDAPDLINRSQDIDNSHVVIFAEHEALSAAGPAIRLNFINRSDDTDNSQIVVFAKTTTDPIAWTVIRNCGIGWNHPFVFPVATGLGVGDSDGNFSPVTPAADGQAFKVVRTSSGDALQVAGLAGAPSIIQVENGLLDGPISALVYKAGRLFARAMVAPNTHAVFEFRPTLWIGAVSQMEQGAAMDPAVVAQIENEFSLLGIASADIVMTGGGSGPDAKPFAFALENVAYG